MTDQGLHVIDFIENFLTLGDSFAGQPFILQPFQKDVIHDMYVTDGSGKRERTEYVLGLPRKNGKSQLAAALALYHLVADPADRNPLVVSAAGDRKQAKLVFNAASSMVRSSPILSRRLEVLTGEIRNLKNGGRYTAVSADAGLQQGLNPSFVVFDELHIFKNSNLIDALRLGQGMRRSPLMTVISTAGYDLESPLGLLYSYGRKVLSGEVVDPTFGMTWFGPPEDREWDYKDPEIWRYCNPMWDIMPNPEKFFTSTLAKTAEGPFIRYFLNGWTSAEFSWLPAGVWGSLEKPGRELQKGEPVVLGFDGSWSGDSTAVVAVSLEDFHIELIGFWEPHPLAIDGGWVVPRDDVRDCIEQAFEYYSVKFMLADPYRFEELIYELANKGLPVMEYPTNSVPNMVKACQKFFEGAMSNEMSWNQASEHGLVLERHVNNAAVKADHRGTRIVKETFSKRIDAAVAAVLAYHGAKMHKLETEEGANAFEFIVL